MGLSQAAAEGVTTDTLTSAAETVVPIELVSSAQGGRKVPIVGEVVYVLPPLAGSAVPAGRVPKYVLLIRDGTGTLRLTVTPEVWKRIPFQDKIQPDVHLKARADIAEIITSDETGKVLKGTLLEPGDLELVLDRPKLPNEGEGWRGNRWYWLLVTAATFTALGGITFLAFFRRRPGPAGPTPEEIRERERAQEALRQGMARVEHLLSAGPSVIYSVPVPRDENDPPYRLSFISDSVSKVLGYEVAECMENPDWWEDNVHPEDRAAVLGAVREAMRRRRPLEREYRFRHKDGTWLWICDQQRLLRNPDGTPSEILGTLSDVTERARTDRMKMIFASLGQRLSAITTKEEAARVALRVADELLGWDASYVSLYSPQEDLLRGVVSYDTINGRRREVPVEDEGVIVTPLIRGVMENGARLIVRDSPESEKELRNLRLFGSNLPSISFLFAPIRKGGKGIGIFSIQSYSADAYKAEDLFLLQLLADYCGAALERTMAEERRKEAEERYALALRGANDGLWDWDLKTNRIYYSPRWKAMIGYEEGEIGDSPNEWTSRIHPNDLERVKADIASHVNGATEQLETQYRMLHKDGTYRWMLMRGVAVRSSRGEATRMAGSLTDVTARKRAEEQLMHGAYYDSLTGLPNRVLFTEQLRRAVSRCRRHPDQLFAVLFIDLDRFKIINDSLGHLVGDQLLVNVAGRLKQCVRPEDMVARLGGDEFTILLEDIGEPSHATRVAERIQEELVKPVNLGGHDVYSTASIGIAFSSTGYDKPEDILRDADAAMYRAKQKGKARHELFDSAMHERALEVLRLEADLRRALERGEFRIHYQPLVCLRTGRVSGFEALMRWEHPQRGMVAPDEFIPLCEENGLIIPIGWWVLREACRQVRHWQKYCPAEELLTVSVNFSRKQFSQPDLVPRIASVLEETGLEPRCLALEMTESVLMENAESLDTLLGSLKALGLQLHIDDFGTGYSSLSYLHRFPIDMLKIDRSFVSRMTPDGGNTELVKAIVNMAVSLGIAVVAEGVETPAQMEVLKSLACDLVQGFLLNKPLEPEAVPALLEGRMHGVGAGVE